MVGLHSCLSQTLGVLHPYVHLEPYWTYYIFILETRPQVPGAVFFPQAAIRSLQSPVDTW